MQNDEHSFEPLPSEPPELEPIFCELANGHTIKIVAALWSRWRTYEEWVAGIRPEPYFAIRIYCTENTLPKRLVWIEEYSEEADFPLCSVDTIWEWLVTLCASREVFDFDGVDDFLDQITDGILHLAIAETDAVEHIKRLPEFTDPPSFDKVDDSIFNDQNDNEPDR